MAEKGLPPNDNRGPVVLAISWATVTLAAVIVSLRLYTRLALGAQAGIDDAAIVLATLLSIFGSVGNTYQVQNGFGRHIEYLNEDQISEISKWTTAVELQNFLGLFLVRLSVCVFLLRIISGSQKWWYRTALYLTIVVNTISTIIIVVCYVLQCIPFRGIWDQNIKARCFSKHVLTNVTRMFGGMSIATDFTCALLPFLIVRHLQLDLRTRTVLCIILGLGVLTAAASIGKTITANVATNDPTYDIVHVEIWALFEDNFGIAIASAPSLRILFGSIRKTLSKKSSNPRTLAQGFSAFKFSITPRSAKSNATFPDEQESQDNLVPMGRVKKTTEVQVDISENLDLERRAQPDGFTPQKECIVND